jgi:uncharacterized membrane protein YccC
MSDPLEQRLIAAYELQRLAYARALELVAHQGQELRHDFDNLGWTEQLTGLLADVADIDRSIAADKRLWQTAGRSPGPQMKKLLDDLGTSIRELSARIDPLIADLRERRQRLLPEIDLVGRQQQMLSAYAASART